MADAVEVTTDLRETIAAELEAARARTLALLAPLSDDELARQHSPIMSPLVWDLAHIGHFEELWLLRHLTGAAPMLPEQEGLYDAFEHGRSERARLALLEPATARSFLGDVRGRVLEVLESIELDPADRLLRDGFVFGLVVQHEHQHVETMLQTLNLREGAEYPLADAPAGDVEPPEEDEVLVTAGPFVLGTDDEPWAYDNERAAHEVDLPSFWIDTAPVTNRAFLGFVEAAGYADQRVWSAEGWARRNEAGLEHPGFWRREGEGGWSRTRFGRREELAPDEPVQHVSWDEADAYSRWAGRRLPTEAEWEKAASWDPEGRKLRYPWGDEEPTGGEANLGGRRFAPAPAGAFRRGASPSGVLQTVGDVWEWTSSHFTGYPGFQSFPYREYSEVFFGSDYRVLRGGSWGTHRTAIRTTFRNWDLPIRRQLFAGLRCARDAG
jgi:gamma-glutamyl hercynylcysteine S-oxide synthase